MKALEDENTMIREQCTQCENALQEALATPAPTVVAPRPMPPKVITRNRMTIKPANRSFYLISVSLSLFITLPHSPIVSLSFSIVIDRLSSIDHMDYSLCLWSTVSQA